MIKKMPENDLTTAQQLLSITKTIRYKEKGVDLSYDYI